MVAIQLKILIPVGIAISIEVSKGAVGHRSHPDREHVMRPHAVRQESDQRRSSSHHRVTEQGLRENTGTISDMMPKAGSTMM